MLTSYVSVVVSDDFCRFKLDLPLLLFLSSLAGCGVHTKQSSVGMSDMASWKRCNSVHFNGMRL